jgi:RHS repeat-associated protein
VWDLSGEEHISYDARGRVEWTVKRIRDAGPSGTVLEDSPLVAYRTSFVYDALDRITELHYPDGDSVSYSYNERSLLKSISGGLNGLTKAGQIFHGMEYAPAGVTLKSVCGNGVHTVHEYDTRLRLRRILTRGGQPDEPTTERELLHLTYRFDGISNIQSIEDQRPESVIPDSDPRRNTQVFEYDDAYRVVRAQYSFGAPGKPVRDDATIRFRYDRIGNMRSKTSTLDLVEGGWPVADVGTLTCGGSQAGAWNRSIRGAEDPAGPHALSSIESTETPTREFRYDGNGNLTQRDGFSYTWDFKDRLVIVQGEEAYGAYVYDYSGRRVVKYVTVSDARGGVADGTSTLYVNKYFEMRENEAASKYVWNGNQRVARVTGQLQSNELIQRIRVFTGWNLCSVVVDGASVLMAEGGLGSGVVETAYLWIQEGGRWEEVERSARLDAGSVLWLNASRSATLSFRGYYAPLGDRALARGGAFVANPTVTPWDWRVGLIEPQAVSSVRFFHVESHEWQTLLASTLGEGTAAVESLRPGDAIFVLANQEALLEQSGTRGQVLYYHHDHLGSSAVRTDEEGNLVSESDYLAYGFVRQEAPHSSLPLDYSFGQKERDVESGLHYFEARYYAASLGRFVTVDPLSNTVPADWLSNPQKLNPYAYALNNPVNMVDPTGLDNSVASALYDLGGQASDRGESAKAMAYGAAYVAWQTFGSESTSVVADKLARGKEISGGEVGLAALDVVTLPFKAAGKGATSLLGEGAKRLIRNLPGKVTRVRNLFRRGVIPAGSAEKAFLSGRAARAKETLELISGVKNPPLVPGVPDGLTRIAASDNPHVLADAALMSTSSGGSERRTSGDSGGISLGQPRIGNVRRAGQVEIRQKDVSIGHDFSGHPGVAIDLD